MKNATTIAPGGLNKTTTLLEHTFVTNVHIEAFESEALKNQPQQELTHFSPLLSPNLDMSQASSRSVERNRRQPPICLLLPVSWLATISRVMSPIWLHSIQVMFLCSYQRQTLHQRLFSETRVLGEMRGEDILTVPRFIHFFLHVKLRSSLFLALSTRTWTPATEASRPINVHCTISRCVSEV